MSLSLKTEFISTVHLLFTKNQLTPPKNIMKSIRSMMQYTLIPEKNIGLIVNLFYNLTHKVSPIICNRRQFQILLC